MMHTWQIKPEIKGPSTGPKKGDKVYTPIGLCSGAQLHCRGPMRSESLRCDLLVVEEVTNAAAGNAEEGRAREAREKAEDEEGLCGVVKHVGSNIGGSSRENTQMSGGNAMGQVKTQKRKYEMR